MKFELENWESVNLSTAKLILDQAEKYLNGTIKTSDFQNKRATVALQTIISLIILLVAFLSSGYSGGNSLLIHLALITIIFYPLLYRMILYLFGFLEGVV